METPIVEHSSRQGAPAPRQAASAPPGLFDLILRDRTEGASSEAAVARPAEDGGAPAVQRPDRATSAETSDGAEQQPQDPALAPGAEALTPQNLATANAPGAVAAAEVPSMVPAAQPATPQTGPQDGKAQALTGAAEGTRGEAQAPTAAETKAAAQRGATQSTAEKAAPGTEAASPRTNTNPGEQAAQLAAGRDPVTATQTATPAASATAATAQTAQAAGANPATPSSATQGPQAPGKSGAKGGAGQPGAASAGTTAAASLPGNSAPVAETQISLAVDPISGMTAGSLDGDAQTANAMRLAGPASLAGPQGADFAGLARAAGEARTSAEQQVAVQIRRAVTLGNDRINIRLSPAELGQVQVRLEVAEDGHVRALISAERAETLDLMQRDPRGLERALQDAGLKTDGDSLSFSLQDGGDGQSEGPGDDTASSPAAREDGPTGEAPSLDTQILRWSAGDGRLDIQV